MSGIFVSLTDGDLKRIAAVLLLIFFNMIFAVVGALMKGGFDPAQGGFDPHKFPEFIYKEVLPYIVGLAFFEAFLHLLPPSQLVLGLFGAPAAPAFGSTVGPALVEAPTSNWWSWLDPAVLWATYAAIIVDLAQKTLRNLAYLFGKTITVVQMVAQKHEEPSA